jgi:hypothetical protein
LTQISLIEAVITIGAITLVPVSIEFSELKPVAALEHEQILTKFSNESEYPVFIPREKEIVINDIINSSTAVSGDDSALIRSATILPIVNHTVFYSGIITFSSSVPLEVDVYHLYDKHNSTNEYKELLNILPSNSTDGMIVASPIIPNQGTSSSVSSSSVYFTGNGLGVRSISGEPFVLAYSMDVTVKNRTEPESPHSESSVEDVVEPFVPPSISLTSAALLGDLLPFLPPEIISEAPLEELSQEQLLETFKSIPKEKVHTILNLLPEDKLKIILDKIPDEEQKHFLNQTSPT